MTWDEMRAKYPDRPYRDEMPAEREREFVADCFDCYEAEGFSERFWSQGGDFPEYKGKPFEVIGRVPELDPAHPDGADLECLPMWRIRFEDGYEMAAYPDEIVPSEMRDNGCPDEFLKGE